MTRCERKRCAAWATGCVAVLLAWVIAEAARAAPSSKPAILSGHEVAFGDSGDPSLTGLQSARAECPPGTGVVSGGFSFGNSGIDAYVLIAKHPSGEFIVQEPGGDPIEINSGWIVSVKRTDGKAEAWAVSAYAVCVETG